MTNSLHTTTSYPASACCQAGATNVMYGSWRSTLYGESFGDLGLRHEADHETDMLIQSIPDILSDAWEQTDFPPQTKFWSQAPFFPGSPTS